MGGRGAERGPGPGAAAFQPGSLIPEILLPNPGEMRVAPVPGWVQDGNPLPRRRSPGIPWLGIPGCAGLPGPLGKWYELWDLPPSRDTAGADDTGRVTTLQRRHRGVTTSQGQMTRLEREGERPGPGGRERQASRGAGQGGTPARRGQRGLTLPSPLGEWGQQGLPLSAPGKRPAGWPSGQRGFRERLASSDGPREGLFLPGLPQSLRQSSWLLQRTGTPRRPHSSA